MTTPAFSSPVIAVESSLEIEAPCGSSGGGAVDSFATDFEPSPAVSTDSVGPSRFSLLLVFRKSKTIFCFSSLKSSRWTLNCQLRFKTRSRMTKIQSNGSSMTSFFEGPIKSLSVEKKRQSKTKTCMIQQENKKAVRRKKLENLENLKFKKKFK